MSVRTILEFPDPRLRARAHPVERFDAQLGKLIDDMFETILHHSSNVRGGACDLRRYLSGL